MRKIRMKGMPIRGTSQYGDLYVVYKVKYTTTRTLKEEERRVLRGIFPCLQCREENEIATHANILQSSEMIHPIDS